MNYRVLNKQLVSQELDLRELLNIHFSDYDNFKVSEVLCAKSSICDRVNALKVTVAEEDISDFYIMLEYIIKSLFFLIQWTDATLHAGDTPDKYLAAAKSNALLAEELAGKIDTSRPSILQLLEIARKVSSTSKISEVAESVRKIACISFPVFYTSTVDSFGRRRTDVESKPTESEKAQPPLIVSVLFFIDNELWANPQLLKKDYQYAIKGHLKLNRWPDRYQKLVLTPVSTTNDEWFILSLPEISVTSETEITINGSIVFKYAQASFETLTTIKLLARFVSDELPSLYPQIVGYDELRVKTVDLNSFQFPTGYHKLNEKAFDIATKLQTELRGLENEELSSFLILLSAILNYQGYCAQHGEYKNVSSILENEFRDKLIMFLSANPMIGEKISKEGHLAGGRVEINYKGIVAELKVESSIQERAKIVEKYKNQPLAYATAVSSRLSILCILDVNKKTQPPGLTINNVFLIKPIFHGFIEVVPEQDSRLAIIIIDANMPAPSKY